MKKEGKKKKREEEEIQTCSRVSIWKSLSIFYVGGRLSEEYLYHGDYDVVRDKFSCVHVFFGRFPVLRSVCNFSAKQIASTDVGQAEFL